MSGPTTDRLNDEVPNGDSAGRTVPVEKASVESHCVQLDLGDSRRNETINLTNTVTAGVRSAPYA